MKSVANTANTLSSNIVNITSGVGQVKNMETASSPKQQDHVHVIGAYNTIYGGQDIKHKRMVQLSREYMISGHKLFH
jgi:hypothetical protein